MQGLFFRHIDLADRILNHFINLPRAVFIRRLFRLLLASCPLFAEQHFANFKKNIHQKNKQCNPNQQVNNRLFCCATTRTGTPPAAMIFFGNYPAPADKNEALIDSRNSIPKPEHILHVIHACGLMHQPLCRVQGALGKAVTALRTMDKLNALARADKHDRMLSHHIAAA